MVEVRIFPCRWIMAVLALSTILPVMRVVLIMAGVTILRRGLKVCESAGIKMTLGAADILVPAFEFENSGIVVEVTETIHAIMTCQAIGAEREQMGLGEGNVHVAVAGLARVRGESRYILTMTISTANRFAGFFLSMFI